MFLVLRSHHRTNLAAVIATMSVAYTIVIDITNAIMVMTTIDIMEGDIIANGDAIAHGTDAAALHHSGPCMLIAGLSQLAVSFIHYISLCPNLFPYSNWMKKSRQLMPEISEGEQERGVP